MRKIDKQEPIECFTAFVRQNLGANWSRDFSSPTAKGRDCYKATRAFIYMEEQNFLCGYTEIYFEDEKKTHIDHYIKRVLDATKTFDWNNLIVAAKDDDFGANHKDKTGIQLNEYSTIFNPVVDDVQDYLEYLTDGEVIPKEIGVEEELINKAKKTIEVFNLNNGSLKSRRKTIIELIESYRNVNLTLDEISTALESSGFLSVQKQYLLED